MPLHYSVIEFDASFYCLLFVYYHGNVRDIVEGYNEYHHKTHNKTDHIGKSSLIVLSSDCEGTACFAGKVTTWVLVIGSDEVRNYRLTKELLIKAAHFALAENS